MVVDYFWIRAGQPKEGIFYWLQSFILTYPIAIFWLYLRYLKHEELMLRLTTAVVLTFLVSLVSFFVFLWLAVPFHCGFGGKI
jgi:hypothetical protein